MREDEMLTLWIPKEEKEKPKKRHDISTSELKSLIESIIFSDGSTWIKKETFMEEISESGISEEDLDKVKDFLYEEEFYGFPYISTKEMCETEKEIAELLYYHAKKKIVSVYSISKIQEIISRIEKESGFIFANQQKTAILKSINSPITVITGVAGAGKTTIIKAILEVFRTLKETDHSLNLAPTGKASKRMEEAMGEEAFTVDSKLLSGSNICENLIFIDETSFLDTKNLKRLLEKTKGSSHLIFLGDPFQLASVGCGMVLRDLIESGLVTVQKLNKSFRIDKDSINLQKNVEKIRRFKAVDATFEDVRLEDGRIAKVLVDCKDNFTEGKDFRMFKDTPTEEVFKKILNTYDEKIKEYGRENVCVLIPFKEMGKGTITSDGFNRCIEKGLFGDTNYMHINSLVMQLENRSYAKNGLIGEVVGLDENHVTVRFEDEEHTYTKEEAKEELNLAYSLSVHKSQGSQYQCVIVVALNEHKKMLTRNLIYTGITRAEKEVDFFFDSKCLYRALNNEESYIRVTALKERISEVIAKYNSVAV